MKKIITLFLFIILLSCSDKTTISNNEIIGEWKLTKATLVNFSSNSTIDYSNQNITYNFLLNGKLLVSHDNVEHQKGEYQYILEEDFLGANTGSEEEKELLVKINNRKWTYRRTNNLMTIGLSYIDGADLFFEKK